MGRGLAVAVAALLVVASPAAAQGGRLAFELDGEVFTMRADGSERTRLTRTPGEAESGQPDWSPDGSRIALATGRRGLRIWSMAADGSDRRPLSTPGRNAADVSPDWAPDGARIAFVRFAFGDERVSTAIAVVDVRTGRERTLIRDRSALSPHGLSRDGLGDPAWSPDGTRLLFSRERSARGEDEGVPDVWVLDVATGQKRRLARAAYGASWSPDGARIAFASVRHRNDETCFEDGCSPHGEIYVANADGSGQTRLTNGSGDEGPPTWTSDGAALVFASSRNVRGSGREELYAMRPDGSCLTWLTNGVETPRAPDWQPGSGGLPESLGCGAVPREPTGLFTPRGAGYWLGQIGPANRLLSATPKDDSKVLIYDDCARFDPLECGLPVQIQNRSSCRRNPLMYDAVYSGARFEVRRGALVYYNDAETGEGADLHTGSRTVTIFTDDPADVPITIDALRPLPSGDPVQTLGPPRFSARVLRQVELARRLRTPAKLARRLKISRARAGFILKFAAALEPFGKLQPADC